MSLLMDALKKAEQAKRLGQTEDTADGSEERREPASLALEPLEPAAAPAEPVAPKASLPELPSQLDVLDAEFMEHIQRTPAVKAPAAEKPAAAEARVSPPPPAEPAVPRAAAAAAQPVATERAAARNVFEAKQAPAGVNKAFAIAVGATTLLAAAGIGIYFWLQLRPARGLAPIAQVVPPRPIPPAAQPEPAAPPAPMPAAAKPTETPQPATAAAQPAPPPPAAEPAAAPAMPPARAATPAPDSPIRITTSKLKLNPSLTRGYEALGRGDLTAAATDYAQVLQAEPKNPDALHGMAAAAVRAGRFDEAEQYYLRAIEADPKDAIAQAGLFGLRGQVDPVASESRLKSLIAAQPDQPFLQFALGNVYAGAGRWNEAQQAFFKAYTGDPEHPDYLFNLAVALDHLRQGKLAAQYYNQALAAATNRPASFDKAQVTARLRELQQ